MRHVHVVISDRGWILERLAKELADRLSYVTYSEHPDSSAALQYYVTYGARSESVSPKEAALFTHLEDDPTARAKFFDVAGQVDCAIAMSKAAARPLLDRGLKHVEIISPGVDLDRYCPVTRIGVVGRTYHTGRKGEALLNELPRIDGIEFIFTGDGWPGPANRIPDAEMPDFYRSLDYVLVPATNEGGPMCVLEALSCGVPVIGADVGWITDFPHIPFEAGNAASLRAVLENLREKKIALRRSVEGRTWETWATAHNQLFTRLLGVSSKTRLRKWSLSPKAEKRPLSVKLLTHGSEGTTQGGPSVRVPRTAGSLRKLGIDAHAGTFLTADALDGDVVHLFNVWTPDTALSAARLAKAAGKQVVFSPILLDLSELGFWSGRLHSRITEDGFSDEVLDRLLSDYKDGTGWKRLQTPAPGFTSQLAELAELSDQIIFLSEHEQNLFRRHVGFDPAGAIVRNPVDANAFIDADPQLFKDHVGVNEFVLCVARLEPRKNQLLLLRAAKELGLPVVLIGHPGADWYERALQEYATDQVHFVGRLDPGCPLLRSAFAGCRVFALPSWAEGAPLAALEAAAAGANLVLSSRSSEREYFGDLARYADPASLEELKRALHDAWFDPERTARATDLKKLVAAEYTWEAYAQRTADVYRAASQGQLNADRAIDILADRESRSSATSDDPLDIIMDVTTSLHHGAMKSGITRVEAALSQAFIANENVNVRFVVWAHGQRRFVEVPSAVVEAGSVRTFLEMGASPAVLGALPTGGSMLVVGSGWMQNAGYAEALSEFAAQHKLALNVVIHDLTPVYWTHWYPKGYSPVFTANLSQLLRTADRLLTYSSSTARDTTRFAAESAIRCPPISRFKLASEIDTTVNEGLAGDGYGYEAESFARSPFVLVVGAIHRRKNYELLYDCWLELSDLLGEGCPHLVIVGGVSWNGEETARALTEDQRIARFVHILTDVDDHKLAWLYRHCALTAYPSLYEGWGLPVAESLAHGKICIASNTSSVPEIAPELTDLIDPNDRKAWTAKILHYVTSKTSRSSREKQIREGFAPLPWTESARTLVNALAKDVGDSADRFLYNLGSVCDLSRTDASHKLEGWYSCETFGSWASANNAILRFDLRPVPQGDLLFVANLRALSQAGEKSPVEVFANGVKVVNWEVDSGADVVRFGIIPRAAIGAGGRLDLGFRTPRTELARHVHPGSPDLRDLGVGLCSVQLVPRSEIEDLVLTGRMPDCGELKRAFIESNHAPANDDVLVRPNAGARLRLPGFLPLQDATLVIAADCAEPGLERDWDAVVMLNGRPIGEVPQNRSSNRLHFFQVPQSVAALHDPAILEIVPKAPYSNATEANALQVFGAAAISAISSNQVIECASGALDLTDVQVQMKAASALVSGGAFPSGIRLGSRSTIDLTLCHPLATVALIRTADVKTSALRAVINAPGADWSVSADCNDRINVVDLPSCGEARVQLSNPADGELSPLVQSVELRQLLPMRSDLLSLGEEAPDFLIAEGFHPPEANHWWSGRWSDRPVSTLCFRNSDRAVERLQIDLEANVSLDKGVRLRISVNEDPKVDLELTQTGQVSCDVEAALAPGAICKLTIEIDRTFMPSQFGFPEDNRVLGIFVRSVRCVSESQSGESYSGLRLASS